MPTQPRADHVQVSTAITRDYTALVAMSLKTVVGEKQIVTA